LEGTTVFKKTVWTLFLQSPTSSLDHNRYSVFAIPFICENSPNLAESDNLLPGDICNDEVCCFLCGTDWIRKYYLDELELQRVNGTIFM
jgi:hypothetical protein